MSTTKPDARARAVKTSTFGLFVVILCAVGLANAVELARVHYGVHVVEGFESFCHFGEGWSCDRVAASPWAVFLGLPVAYWGILGYLLMGGLGLWLLKTGTRQAAGALLVTSGAAVTTSLVLLALSVAIIGAACPLCTVAHGINLAVAVLAAVAATIAGGLRLAARSFAQPQRLLALAGAPLGCGVVLSLVVPAYWDQGPAPTGPAGLAVGTTETGSPWIGAHDPRLTIIEFSDYQCPHCRRGHQALRQLVAEHPDCVRLVHHSYPLDHQCNPAVPRPFHERACELSCLAYCAGEQGRFWEANDLLFQCMDEGPVNEARLCAELDLDRAELSQCLASERPSRALHHELEAGRLAGVQGTPSFIVDGRLHVGGVPEEVIRSHLEGHASPRSDQDGG